MVTAQVFVIYSEIDNNVLRSLVCEYNGQTFGQTTLQIHFLSSEDATYFGEDFGEIIQNEIDSSTYVIVIITPNSVESLWVNQEVGYSKKVERILGRRFILPLKLNSMSREGFGLIHSNIDMQIFRPGQRKFRKLDEFFKNIFHSKASKVVKRPLTIKPVAEGSTISTRRAEPDVL